MFKIRKYLITFFDNSEIIVDTNKSLTELYNEYSKGSNRAMYIEEI